MKSKKNGILANSLIVPKIKLQISTSIKKISQNIKDSNDSKRRIPFLCAHLNSEVLPIDSESDRKANNFFLMIGYGNVNKPVFERISYSDCEKYYLSNNGVLERTNVNTTKTPSLINDDTNNMKIKSKQSAKDIEKTTVIGPAGIMSSQPLFNNINNKNGYNLNGDTISDEELEEEEINNNFVNLKSPKKVQVSPNKSDNQLADDSQQKQSADSRNQQLTLEEQLAKLSADEKVKRKKNLKDLKKHKKHKLSMSLEQPNTDSLVNVLMQGLKSNDIKMLETVLNSNETVIQNTLKKLPVSYIPLLVTELQRGLFKQSDQQAIYLKWISLMMKVKISYFMSVCYKFSSLSTIV